MSVEQRGEEPAATKTPRQLEDEYLRACSRGNVEAVRSLIGKQFDANARSAYGYTGFMAACEKGRLEVVRLLMANAESLALDFTLATGKSQTAMLLAGHERQEEVLLLLLTLPDAPQLLTVQETCLLQRTVLHHAALLSAATVKAVIARLPSDANMNAMDRDNLTPLHVALVYEQEEAAMALLEAGGDRVNVNALPRYINTAYESCVLTACNSGVSTKLLQAILRHSGGRENLSVPNPRAKRLLPSVCEAGRAEALACLLDTVADDLPLGETDNRGRTGLHWASEKGHIAMVRGLLHVMSPEQVSLPDGQGKIARELATNPDVLQCFGSGPKRAAC